MLANADLVAKYPFMVVQAHTLAAKAFADEVQGMITRLNMKHASKLTMGLDICLQGLRELEETLVTFPEMAYDDEETTV